MSFVFVSAFGIGAAVIAAWLDVRFGSIRPRSLLGRAALAIGAGMVLGAAPVSGASLTMVYATIFGAVFPALVLTFVSVLWLLRAVMEPEGVV